MSESTELAARRSGAVRRLVRLLGPGLVTGAADDDPSGIATYSQAGAQFGYALCWTMFLTLPFMAAIQIISACIGWQTRRRSCAQPRTANAARRCSIGLVALLVIANTINIAADLAAMAEALRLVIGGPVLIYAGAFGIVCLVTEVFIPYHRYAGYLKFLTLVLLVYVAAAFTIEVPWGKVMAPTLFPALSIDRDYLLTVVAVFGTTISPYLFFWQASQEAEESRLSFRRIAPYAGPSGRSQLLGHLDRYLDRHGVLQSDRVLHHRHHGGDAERTRDHEDRDGFAGRGSVAAHRGRLDLRAVCRRHHRHRLACRARARRLGGLCGRRGLRLARKSRTAGQACAWVSTGSSARRRLAARRWLQPSIDPIAMLFWSAVINGIVAVPIMVAVMLVVSRRQDLQLPTWLRALGWLATALMALAVGLFIWSSLWS